jgi:hypothetical protein
VQVWVAYIAKDREIVVTTLRNNQESDRLEKQHAKDWSLQVAKFLNDNRNQIFSRNNEDRENIACVIQSTFPSDVCDRLFGKLASSSNDQNRREFWRKYQTILPDSTQINDNTSNKTITGANVNENIKDEPISPRVNAEPIANTKLYNYTIWLDLTDKQKKQIHEVEYQFDHPSFKQKTQVSSDAKKGFLVSYKGWGAIDSVPIKVRYNDGHSAGTDLDMIKALGW